MDVLDGRVAALEEKQFQIKQRKACLCLVCLHSTATQVALPCLHYLYCAPCLDHAKVCMRDGVCPLCSDRVTEYKVVHLK